MYVSTAQPKISRVVGKLRDLGTFFSLIFARYILLKAKPASEIGFVLLGPHQNLRNSGEPIYYVVTFRIMEFEALRFSN